MIAAMSVVDAFFLWCVMVAAFAPFVVLGAYQHACRTFATETVRVAYAITMGVSMAICLAVLFLGVSS